MNETYMMGFSQKCAEAGVDPEQLVKWAEDHQRRTGWSDVAGSAAAGGGLGAAAGSVPVGLAALADLSTQAGTTKPSELGRILEEIEKVRAAGPRSGIGGKLEAITAELGHKMLTSDTTVAEQTALKLIAKIMRNKGRIIGIPAAIGAAALGGRKMLRKADETGNEV